MRGRGHASVTGREDVTTKAGTFHTFTLETTINNGNSMAKIDTWYAPSADHWVRRITELRAGGRLVDKYVEELVEYSRRPSPGSTGDTGVTFH